jgi:hypothetical protein
MLKRVALVVEATLRRVVVPVVWAVVESESGANGEVVPMPRVV